MRIVSLNKSEHIRELHQLGADLNAFDNVNTKIIRFERLSRCFFHQEGNNAAILAAKDDCIESIRILFELGVDVESKNAHDGKSVLMEACIYGRASTIKELLFHGAKVNSTDNV